MSTLHSPVVESDEEDGELVSSSIFFFSLSNALRVFLQVEDDIEEEELPMVVTWLMNQPRALMRKFGLRHD